MKKLLLIGIIFLTGCTNPISSAIDKEGDKTRAEMQAEIEIARQEIAEETKRQLASATIEINGTVIHAINYLTMVGFYR
jgi:ssRNA-specific RNase YbeY (16S rRNA maturation enzyme)